MTQLLARLLQGHEFLLIGISMTLYRYSNDNKGVYSAIFRLKLVW